MKELNLKQTNGELYVDIKNQLNKSICEVTFEKLSGEERVMTCTLQEDFIPNDMKPKGTGKSSSYESVSAYDIKAQGWRSFRLDKIKKFVIEN